MERGLISFFFYVIFLFEKKLLDTRDEYLLAEMNYFQGTRREKKK